MAKKRTQKTAKNMTQRKADYSDVKIIGMWLVPILACLVVMIVMRIYAGSINRELLNTQALQEQQFHENKQTFDLRKNELDALERNKKAAESKIPIANEKNAADDQVAADYFRHFLTWASGEQYEELRREMLKFYGEDSSVISCWFPEQWNLYDEENMQLVWYIDAEHLNSEYQSLDAYMLHRVEGVNGTRYAAWITTANQNKDVQSLQRETKNYYYVEYDVTDKQVQNVEVAMLGSIVGD